MKKKIMALVLTLLLSLSLIPGTAFAATVVDSGSFDAWGTETSFTWTLDSEGLLTISGMGRYSDQTKLAQYRNVVKSVRIENGITEIEDGAFESYESLISITIPNSVTSIGGYAFYNCSNLTSISIPNSVKYIGNSAFGSCTSLESITLPNGMDCIAYGVFKDCTRLKNIDIPDKVTYILESAFANCTSLKSITLPDSVTSISTRAFFGCTGLQSITLPDSVTSIGSGAFVNCTSLKSIIIPDGVTLISAHSFWECIGLQSVTIPDSVTSIGYAAFYGCTGLTSITIPDSVTSISEVAFLDCTGLTSIVIPGSVTNIGSGAFLDCASLTDVYYGGTEEQWKEISIEQNNEEFANATIHYQKPSSFTVTFHANGGSVSTASKTVANGETYGSLPAATRDNFSFDGWYTSSSGGTQITSSTTVDLTENQTLYAHWTALTNPYNLGDETYSFQNFGDSDSLNGHCFGMSITSAGYYTGLLDIGSIGGNANTPLYSFDKTQTVIKPICNYHKAQGKSRDLATVAGQARIMV